MYVCMYVWVSAFSIMTYIKKTFDKITSGADPGAGEE